MKDKEIIELLKEIYPIVEQDDNNGYFRNKINKAIESLQSRKTVADVREFCENEITRNSPKEIAYWCHQTVINFIDTPKDGQNEKNV